MEMVAMLRSANGLRGHTVLASDGAIGRVHDTYFDDERWTVRYLVIDTGGWLSGRRVLVSPIAVRDIDGARELVEVDLTRQQVENSPSFETDRPVSRQMESRFNGYYGYAPYWGYGMSGSLWGVGSMPIAYEWARQQQIAEQEAGRHGTSSRGDPADDKPDDVHLRSLREVTGYGIEATDGQLGEIEDFLIDAQSWAIEYLVVDPRRWWPGPAVLLLPRDVKEVSWERRVMSVALSQEDVRASPTFDPKTGPARADESRRSPARRGAVAPTER